MKLASSLGFGLIGRGFRTPRVSAWSKLDQWSQLISLLKDSEVNVFLDVGANKGFFAKHLRECGYTGLIISFEPIKADCEHIKTVSAHDLKWSAHPVALGAKDCETSFNVNTISGGHTVLSSFLPLKYEGVKSVAQTVPVRRIDTFVPPLLSDVQNPRIFLKMDTQGFDDQVIAGAGSLLENIVGLQSEISVVPLYEGMLPYTDSLRLYNSLGFELLDLYAVNRTDDGLVTEYDCVMKRV